MSIEETATASSNGTSGAADRDVDQQHANERLWARNLVGQYRGRGLRPVEVMLLVRYREALAGRVLELGCGAGRLTGYLGEIATQAQAIDVSSSMVAACASAYPKVSVTEGDIRDLSHFADDSLDAIIGTYNIIDVLDDVDRKTLLDDMRRILAPGGTLIVSTHNRAAAPPARLALELRKRGILRGAFALLRAPRWIRNRKRVLPHERQEAGYAILNDASHDYEALHYYIDPDDQLRQFEAHGYDLVECMDVDGQQVIPGGPASSSSELHYVARPSAVPHGEEGR